MLRSLGAAAGMGLLRQARARTPPPRLPRRLELLPLRVSRDRILRIAATLQDGRQASLYKSRVAANARTLALAHDWLGHE